MNEEKRARIDRFLKDKATSYTIKEVLVDECLKTSKDRDVQNLAARFLAIEILNGAWKEMEKYSNNTSEVTKEPVKYI